MLKIQINLLKYKMFLYEHNLKDTVSQNLFFVGKKQELHFTRYACILIRTCWNFNSIFF